MKISTIISTIIEPRLNLKARKMMSRRESISFYKARTQKLAISKNLSSS